MTPAEIGGGARQALTWIRALPVAVLALAAILVPTVLLLRQCEATADLEAQLAAAAKEHDRAAAEATAREKGLLVVARAKQEEVNQVVAQIPPLRAALAAAEAEVGRLTVKYVISGRTAGAPARGRERPGEAPALAPESVAASSDEVEKEEVAESGAPTPRLPAVLLRAGDVLQLSLDAAVAEGEEGAETVHALVGAIRMSDGELLSRQALSAPLTRASSAPTAQCPDLPPPARNRWQALATGGTGGWGGEVVLSHRFDVWRWHPEVAAKGEATGQGARFGVGVGGSF